MELKAGLIGCGEMGEIHANVLKNLTGMKMAAYCDTNPIKAESLLNKYGGDYYTDDYTKLLKDDSLSAIYICTYHDTHALLAKECCEYKKNVMIEKPLALSIKENYEIAEIAEKSGVLFMVALKARFYPSIQKTKEFIKNPVFTIAQMMDSAWDDSFWANDPLKGGGNVLSQGCHTMDLLYYLNESEPESIFAYGGNFNHKKLDIIDNVSATVKFKNGAVASVSQGDSGVSGLTSKYSIQVFDGKKSAHLFNRLKSARFNDLVNITEHEDPEEYAFIEENKYFINCLKNNIKPFVNWKDGLRATVMVLSAFESIKTNLPQEIKI
jgi:predicted dehydrogenase